MINLPDVNVLIALVDSGHVHHQAARVWFRQCSSSGWATTAITENGLLRIMGNPRYPGGPGSVEPVLALLTVLRTHPGHAFWGEHVSLAEPGNLSGNSPLKPDDITDAALLALAVARGGILVTFDRRLNPAMVVGGEGHLHVLQAG
jgi:uncharacterized protein